MSILTKKSAIFHPQKTALRPNIAGWSETRGKKRPVGKRGHKPFSKYGLFRQKSGF
jgi:hypothetical protein